MGKKIFFIISLCLLTIGTMGPSASATNLTVIKVSIAHDVGKNYTTSYVFQMYSDALNYSWTVDNKIYLFEPVGTNIYLLLDENKAELDKYDVHIESGIQQTQECYKKGYSDIILQDDITPDDYVPNLIDFIENKSHGYIGVCSSAAWAVPQSFDTLTTYLENYAQIVNFLKELNGDIKETSHIGIEAIDEYLRFYIKDDNKVRPRFFPIWLPQPKKIGEVGYFEYFPHYNNCANDQYHLGGFPVNVTILDPDNPIFKDYLGKSIRMRFGGGMSFVVEPDATYVSKLAAFPDNADTIYNFTAWHFPFWYYGRLRKHVVGQLDPWWLKSRILAAYIGQYLSDGDFERVLSAFENTPANPADFGDLLNEVTDPTKWFYNTTGWKQKVLGKPIQYLEPHLNNNISLVAFNYPNGDENGGRVILNGCHPEFATWDTNDVNIKLSPADSSGTKWQDLSLYNGLNLWKIKLNETSSRNMTIEDAIKLENAWFIQRETAWASKKVPDTDLPPAYGRSQVVDTPALQEGPTITIKCCVGKYTNEIWLDENLSLYYRYRSKSDNSWTAWTRYSSIHQSPYHFTFDSRMASGNGHYEFCSLFNTTGLITKTECFPPGADASCYIGGNIIADYSRDINLPYVNQTINFTSQSLTKEGTSITQYDWSFGNGDHAIGEDPYINYTYTEPGTYTVNLTVTNNQSQQDTIRKNITVLNNLPQASFNIYENVSLADNYDRILPIDTQILLYDSSTDSDGSIVNRSWAFGDTGISYGRNPTHTYTQSGPYTMTLCVTDNDGGIDTRTANITIFDTMADTHLTSDNASAHKWKTIQKAIDNTSTNGVIYVTSGTYNENISIPKSLTIFGHNRENTIIHGKVTITAPHDYELPNNDTGEWFLIMNNTDLLLHCNNDSTVGENYAASPMIHDYSDNNRTVTNHGATWTINTTKGTGSFSFDGIDDTINLTTIPALTSRNTTFSTWICWTGGSTGIKPILTQLKTPTQGYSLAINDTTDTPILQLNTTIIASPTALTTGWHNIVGFHNTTTLALYVDGVCKATQTLTGQGTNARGFIGYDNNSHYFNGKIDEIAIWNRSLTSDEIYSLYNENIGVIFQGLTVEGSFAYGIIPCNNTEIFDCSIKNFSIGIPINNLVSVRISDCNITGCDTGILVNDSNPDHFNRLRFVSCNLINVTHGIIVNNSNNVTVIHTLINGSQNNLTFNGGDYQTLFVTDTTTPNNLKPTTPILRGTILGDPRKTYQYSACSNDTNHDQLTYRFDWGDSNTTGWQNFTKPNITVYASHSWAQEGGYFVNVTAKDIFQNESETAVLLFRTENLPPIIHAVSNTPGTIGFGGNITITANVTDNTTSNYSGIKTVIANITYPDQSYNNLTMTMTANNTYTLIFTDTWMHGRYNYTIWAMDNAYNTATSSQHYFYVNATASISISTLRDSYSSTNYINITDPPNPPENYTVVDRGLTWNTYYNATSGQNILEVYQGPMNYQDDNNTWIPINNTINQLTSNHPAYVYGYRTGNDHGLYGVYFKSNAQQEWPVAFTFNRSDDPTIHAIRSKLVGVGYVDPQNNWSYQYLQNVQNSQGQTNEYSITYPGVFTGTDVTWSYGNTGLKEEITLSNATKTMLQNHPPSQYGLNDTSSYLVFITKLDYQSLNLYNNSGLLDGNVTISDTGADFKDALGQFKCALPLGEAYELNNESARQKLTYRIVHLNGDTYLLSGLKVSDLYAMTFPVVVDPTLTVYSVSNDGYIYNSGFVYSTVQSASSGTVDSSSIYVTIGQKRGVGPTYYVYRGFVLFNTSALPSNAYLDDATLSLYKKDDYSTMDFDITIQNGQPTYPHNPMQTGDYYRGYYSGNGGSLNTSRFTSGYNAIPLNNLSWINTTGITKLCLRSSRDISGTAPTGNEYINVYSGNAFEPGGGITYKPKLIITYRNQSKIKDTGSTDINGYLLIQIHFYETGKGVAPRWVVDNDTINETYPRAINSSDQLALDTIFNGLVRASDLTHGTGTYRVYAAFRDPEGNILRTNNDVDLEAWWQFSKI